MRRLLIAGTFALLLIGAVGVASAEPKEGGPGNACNTPAKDHNPHCSPAQDGQRRGNSSEKNKDQASPQERQQSPTDRCRGAVGAIVAGVQERLAEPQSDGAALLGEGRYQVDRAVRLIDSLTD